MTRIAGPVWCLFCSSWWTHKHPLPASCGRLRGWQVRTRPWVVSRDEMHALRTVGMLSRLCPPSERAGLERWCTRQTGDEGLQHGQQLTFGCQDARGRCGVETGQCDADPFLRKPKLSRVHFIAFLLLDSVSEDHFLILRTDLNPCEGGRARCERSHSHA